MRSITLVGLVGLTAACSGAAVQEPPAAVAITIAAVGTLRYGDGAPVVGATIYKYATLLSPSEQSTLSDANGNFALTYVDRCIPGSYSSGVGITPPATRPIGAAVCTGEIMCITGTQRRDCTF